MRPHIEWILFLMGWNSTMLFLDKRRRTEILYDWNEEVLDLVYVWYCKKEYLNGKCMTSTRKPCPFVHRYCWTSMSIVQVRGAPSCVRSGRERRNRLSQNWSRNSGRREIHQVPGPRFLIRRRKIDLYFFNLLCVSGNSKQLSKNVRKKKKLEKIFRKQFCDNFSKVA